MKNKTLIAKIVFAAIAGLLVTSASAIAQVAPPTPASVAPNYGFGSETSFVLPKAAPAPNLYLEAGVSFAQAKSKAPSGYHTLSGKSSEILDAYGTDVAFGWRINKNNKIQVELGMLFAEEKYRVNNVGVSITLTENYFIVPLLFSYSYCIPLDSKGQWELRLTPTAGFYTINYELEVSGHVSGIGQASVSDDDSDSVFVYGGGVGMTYHINNRFYVDAGYRYTRGGSTQYTLNMPPFGSLDAKSDSIDAHALTISFGWKF